jgi:hypothetical protein
LPRSNFSIPIARCRPQDDVDMPHEARLRGQGINVSVLGPSSTRLDAERRRPPPLVGASVH